MNYKWNIKDECTLKNKTIVLTGATGGLGASLCRYLLSFDVKLYMINRNEEKSRALVKNLTCEYPNAQVNWMLCDLNDMEQVKSLSLQLQKLPIDILMLNAGVYALPKAFSRTGYNTVFQTNFLSQYFLVKTLLPQLEKHKAKVVVTGSIAHRFNPIDLCSLDFSQHKKANDIYGNSKRFLMFSIMELLKNTSVEFAIGHPGISLTGITSNYPPKLLKIVKPGMRILFMPPKKACLSILQATCTTVPYCHWIGPAIFDIWGKPTITILRSCKPEERTQIFKIAEEMYKNL